MEGDVEMVERARYDDRRGSPPRSTKTRRGYELPFSHVSESLRPGLTKSFGIIRRRNWSVRDR